MTTVGKETNKLDDVQASLHATTDEILVEYDSRDAEVEQALAVLAKLSGRDLQRLTGIDRRTIDRVRLRGTASPRVRAAIVAGALLHATPAKHSVSAQEVSLHATASWREPWPR